MTMKGDPPVHSPVFHATAPPEDDIPIPIAEAVIVTGDAPPAYAPGMEPSSTGGASGVAASHQQQLQQPPTASTSTTSNTSSTNRPATKTTTTTTYTLPASTTGGAAASSAQQPPPPIHNVNLPGLTNQAARINCPYCNQQNVTRTRSQIDACTILAVVLLLFFFFPLFWLPFVCPCCMSTEHYCSRCHRKVGTAPPCNC